MAIKYTKSNVSDAYRTIEYGNLLADTVQGEVYPDDDGKWVGWFTNWSDPHKSEFKFGFGSRAAASRWVNSRLRARGVK